MEIGILNIVFGCPESAGEDAPRALASLYAELLGMRIIREEWLRIGKDEDTLPRLAFDDRSPDPPPRWPDPEFPQQVHLDITVPDLDAAEASALRLGASPLQDKGEYRSYADPAGHPFCLYGGGTGETGRLERIVFDCFSPRALAAFYSELMGMRTIVLDSSDRVVISKEGGQTPMLAFQRAPLFKPPRWPDPMYPPQIHLDLDVEDGPAGQELAERLGAVRLQEMGGSCPVYADPSAHPFCLCSPGQ